jgi:formylglycine-generating enzyme required for sulfatase activity
MYSGAYAIARDSGTEGMVRIPGGKFSIRLENSAVDPHALDTLVFGVKGRRYIQTRDIEIPAYYIDKTEVTNRQFKEFIDETGYSPSRPGAFLEHWKNGSYPESQADHPVVWVSLQDAEAYAKWAGKRLPTDEEWQLAAQGTDSRIWPWGNNFDPAKGNMDSEGTKPVGSYPQGASPYGCFDMAGNVWEWVGTVETDGYHNYAWIRGGGYWNAVESGWYIRGGPVEVMKRERLWLMAAAINRCATVGFRCVKDIN